MKRLTSSDIWLRQEIPSSDSVPARSRIIADGGDTGQVVDGALLEAAVQWKSDTLLFLTDDTPFEEFLRIYLFDVRWKLLDQAAIGAMYSTGVFTDLEMLPPDALHFKFFRGSMWKLKLLDSAVFSLPFSSPRSVSRPFSFYKRFDLIEQPTLNHIP